MVKKILLVCHSSEKSGGGEDDFFRILRYLKNKFIVYSAFPPGQREKMFSENSQKYFYIPNKYFPLMGLNLRYFISKSYAFNFFRTVSRLRRFIKENKDLDMAVLNSSVCYIEAMVLSFYKIPYIIFLREKLNPHIFRKLIYKLYNKHAFRIIAVSGYLKEMFLKYESSDRIEILNAPIEEEYYESQKTELMKTTFKESSDQFVVTQVGAIGNLKCQETTVKALLRLHEENKVNNRKILIRLIGKHQDDEYNRNLKNLAKNLPVNIKLEFTGEISKENLIAYLLLTDCIVIASREEGASLVFSEGLFLEIPVVATKVADLPKMIENYTNGLIFEIGDHIKLSEYLYELLTNPEIKEKIIRNSKLTYYKFFNLNDNLQRLENIIKSL